MSDAHLDDRDYRRIERAIRYLDEHWQQRPGLAVIARAAGLSPWHFNRLFRRWAGVTPKQYLQWLALDAAKSELRTADGSVLAAAYAAGCSGPGRLHDLFVTLEAMSPGEYRDGGRGVTVRYGFAPTPFGTMLAARTERGICRLEFVDDGEQPAHGRLAAEWPNASLVRDDGSAVSLAMQLWPPAGATATPSGLTLAVRGTNFQLQVWRALLVAGERAATTYGALAAALGAPRASRAVGGAVGENPVGWIIPCHRVLRRGGALGGYRWDPARKRTILAWEYVRHRLATEHAVEGERGAASMSAADRARRSERGPGLAGAR
jgi:AraC family transcriptional regulator of adaptative response/methylated-DNA-[protein]-cysteine methyltransferase